MKKGGLESVVPFVVAVMVLLCKVSYDTQNVRNITNSEMGNEK